MEVELGEDDLRLDRTELKVLASDTRVEILRNLKGRNYTVSELSQKLGHSKSTMHEHLNRLLETELIEKADNYTDKWVYYRLSQRGKSLFVDSTKRVVVILSSVLLIVGVMQLAVFFTSVQLLSPVQEPVFIATGPEAEEAIAPGAIAKTYAVPRPMPEEEQRIAPKEEVVPTPAAQDLGAQLPAQKTEEIPHYLIGGTGFICAAFTLMHYYHTKPLKLNMARKRRRRK